VRRCSGFGVRITAEAQRRSGFDFMP
jgi:hypothetical protein